MVSLTECPVSGVWKQVAVFSQRFAELNIFRNPPEIQRENNSTSSTGTQQSVFIVFLMSLEKDWF